ncbi:hypothetical protein ONZ45_g18107 [Pleurotus djamor]|nr:hypothetical protein ONZ45_g18107 [Pleurotus djamor]
MLEQLDTGESSSIIPLYTPSEPPPEYASTPASNEKVLDFTPGSRRRPTDTFTRRDGRVSVILDDQEQGALPSYGQNAFVNGMVYLGDSSAVTEVSIKIEGHLDVIVPSTFSRCQKIMNKSCTLYSATSGLACPATLQFSFPFPSMFISGEREYPTPPSFDTLLASEGGLYAKARYQLVVTVAKDLSWRTVFQQTKLITIPLRYLPRHRPERPIVEDPCLLKSIKTTPEDWKQFSAKIQPVKGKPFAAVSVELFIPSTQIFALSDTIPIHLQLLGETEHLLALIPQLTPDVYPTNSSESSGKPLLRLCIMRRYAVENQDEIIRSNTIIGQGTLTPLPPSASHPHGCLDWKGELTVKDHILLTIAPGGGKHACYEKLQIAVPIRLVTDSWSPGAYAV